MSINAGEFRCRINVTQRSNARDALNNPSRVFLPFKTLWAKPIGTSGYSAQQAATQEGVTKSLDTVTWRIRFREDINNSGEFRVEYGGKLFDIKLVRPDLANREWVDLVCQVSGDG